MSVLNNHVLTLNRSWTVIGTTSVREAVMLLMRGSAKVLAPETFLTYNWEDWLEESSQMTEIKTFIKTPSLNIAAPQIILLSNYDDIYRTTVKFSSLEVFKRDGFICAYCNQKKRREDLSIDHIIPQSKKGPTNWLNCVTSCTKCNNFKGNRSLQESGLKLHFNPTIPKWSPVIHIKPEHRLEAWKPLIKDS